MTNSEPTTRHAELEAGLAWVVSAYERFHNEHPDEDVDAACEAVDAVVDRIVEAPLDTLGDIRLRAKALMVYRRDFSDSLDDYEEYVCGLLEALEALPQRLWDEPIAPG